MAAAQYVSLAFARETASGGRIDMILPYKKSAPSRADTD